LIDLPAAVSRPTSAYGTELTSRDVGHSSAYEAEADMPNILADVR
jgi:hypothetical protein